MIKLYYGDEPYCMDSQREKLLADVPDLSYLVSDVWNNECVQFAHTVPLWYPKNIIILRLRSKLGADEELLKYLKKTVTTCDLYIFAPGVDRNTKVFKALKKDYEVEESNKVSSEIMKKWVLKRVSDAGCKITEDAFSLLLERTKYWDNPECTLYTIRGYLSNLCFLSDTITVDMVMDVIPRTFDEKVFSLSSYLLAGEPGKLFTAANALIEEKEQPIAMLSAILRTFRLAYKASLYKDVKPAELSKLLGVPSLHYAGAMKYEPDVMKECMDLLQGGVNKIKNGYPSVRVFYTTLGSLSELCK